MREGIYFGESPENLRRKDILRVAAREQIAAINREKNQKIKEAESLRDELLVDAEKDLSESKPRDYPTAIKINRIKYEAGAKIVEIGRKAERLIADIELGLKLKLDEIDGEKTASHKADAKHLNDSDADAAITKELNEIGKRNRLS